MLSAFMTCEAVGSFGAELTQSFADSAINSCLAAKINNVKMQDSFITDVFILITFFDVIVNSTTNKKRDFKKVAQQSVCVGQKF